ncbi:MAG: hypothetical protein JXO22_07160, partial [Phycisphaerae bacterium]|nr:hypothetical protein [Phycisphaerae bacterium]
GGIMRNLIFVTLVTLMSLAGCATPSLTVHDAIVGRSGRVLLVAYVSRESIAGLQKGLANLEINFSIAGQPVGTATTNSHGRAMLECTPSDLTTHDFTARTDRSDAALSCTGQLFVWDSDQSAIVVDIDKTLCDTDHDHLYLKASDDSPPIVGAAEALTALASDYYIAYLTARPHFLFDKTRQWLADNGFPDGPLLMAQGWKSTIRYERYKRRELLRLREFATNLLIGIGDRESDAEAYVANGMLAIHMTSETKTNPVPLTIALADWHAIRRFFEVNRQLLTRPDVLRGQIDNGTLMDELVTATVP